MNATLASSLSAAYRSERVEFPSQGEKLVGTLFRPAEVSEGAALPGVVVSGAWMTVKEQMPSRYAKELAARGFAALAFDFRGWGESGGDRRQLEDPEAKTDDLLAAFLFMASREGVDPGKLAGLGICASAGYQAAVAAGGVGPRSLALVAPWLQDSAIVEAVYGGKTGVAALLETARIAEADYRADGAQRFVPAASKTDKSALMFGAPYYTEDGRGLIPEWRNEVDPAFWSRWLEFDGLRCAPELKCPLLLVHSEAAAIPQGARKFFADMRGPKRELWLEGVTQFDFYDKPDAVSAATDAVAEHFKATL